MAAKSKKAKKSGGNSKPASKPAAPKLKAIGSKQTKTQIYQTIADTTGLKRKDIAGVMDTLGAIVAAHMGAKGSGEITVPSVGVKIRRVTKPATKAREGVNPFTGEKMMIKAKPKRAVVRVTALKGLKGLVAA